MTRFALMTGGGLFAAMLSAHAAPTVTLGARERAATQVVVRDARVSDERVFYDLDESLRRWLDLPAGRRNEAVLSRSLRALGQRQPAVLIDALALGLRVDVPNDLRATVDTALVEALGRLKSGRALPVLRAAFVGQAADSTRVAAARGLAASCRDPEAKLLLGHAITGDPLFRAAVEGLGRCLRADAAERLGDLLSAAPDSASARPIAAALGRLASQRIWTAPIRRDDPAGVRVRATAVRALAGAIARLDDAELPRALAVVNHPETPAFLDRARAAAGPAGRVRLDRAASRVRRRLP